MVAPENVKVRDVATWCSFKKYKNRLPVSLEKIDKIHQDWDDACIAYINSPWLALVDRGTAIVSYSPQAPWFKLWAWGRDVFNKPLSSHYQPYFEPWRSPLNKDFYHGDPVSAGQVIEWEERIFMLTNVSAEDVPGIRQRIETKIASFGF